MSDMHAPTEKNKKAVTLSLHATLSFFLINTNPQSICPTTRGKKAKNDFVVRERSSQL